MHRSKESAMRDEKSAENLPSERSVSRTKAGYSAPSLWVYGPVSKLTAGGGSNGADMDSMQMGDMGGMGM